jgi:nicotinamide-nucleotide amidase
MDNRHKIHQTARSVIERATAQGRIIVTAESCTGGMVAACLTDVAGSSAVLDRGLVTYSNQAKMDLLGVPPTTLDRFGAVSAETAAAMADGALAATPAAHIAIAITGIAGPGGGSSEKPVGLVYFGIAKRGIATKTAQHIFSGNRDDIRQNSVEKALDLISNTLE